jgi:hypothetical protein
LFQPEYFKNHHPGLPASGGIIRFFSRAIDLLCGGQPENPEKLPSGSARLPNLANSSGYLSCVSLDLAIQACNFRAIFGEFVGNPRVIRVISFLSGKLLACIQDCRGNILQTTRAANQKPGLAGDNNI